MSSSDARRKDTPRVALGVDIGGSGIKGAPVNVDNGELLAERFTLKTPDHSTPEVVSDLVRQVAGHFGELIDQDTPIGITIPGVVQRGVVRTAANIHQDWIGCRGQEIFTQALGRHCILVNDADAAGVGEERFGAAKDENGFVILVTLGTGIGTALIHEGQLIPNSELGHLEMNGDDAEHQAAASVRTKEGLSYPQFAERLQQYLSMLENLMWPDLIVIGGGISRDHDKFCPLLDLRTPVVPAQLRNSAGIIGAAALAADAPR